MSSSSPSQPDSNQNRGSPSPPLLCPSKEFPISPIHALSTPTIEIEHPLSPVGSGGTGGNLYDDKENDFEGDVELGEDAFYPNHGNQKRFCSTPSPHRYNPAGNDGMRHHLLVQRTFNHHEADCLGPLTSSPLRKVPLIVSPGGLTPSTSKYSNKESCSDGCYSNIGSTPQFKTPVRGQHDNHPDRDRAWERTPSAPRTPAGFLSPASSLYAFSTPGRQFVNPFEVDHERLHLPVLTPSMFQAKQKDVESSAEKEGFWTVEQRALMMPVEIKESEILRQHFYQTKRAKEMDPLMQVAVDRFFANELIVPSPWSEQKGTRSAGGPMQTPTSGKSSAIARSVSCQTTMSVPPDVDLLAELEDKYRLPDDQLVHESPVDSSLSLPGGFIRRKLLHQLNENDSVVVGASPVLPLRTLEDMTSISASPSPSKQATPEIEKQTPNKKSSGHFSSSPIRPTGDRGNYPAMSESDLLASPELSPIAGRGSNKPLRSSDMFTPRQEFERSREIMQLDFSSILDEPDEFDNANVSEKTGTLIQTKDYNTGSVQALSGGGNYSLQDNCLPEDQYRITDTKPTHIHDGCGVYLNDEAPSPSLFHPNSDKNCSLNSCNNNNRSLNNTLKKSLLTSAESSTQDILQTNVPNLLSSQDTGYQTASLQSITNLDSASNPQSQLQDIYSSSCSSANQSLMMMTNTNVAQSKLVPSSSTSSIDFPNFNPSSIVNDDCIDKDHSTLHASFTNRYTGIVPNTQNHKSDLFTGEEGNSLDSYLSSGTRLSYLFSDDDNNNKDIDFYSNSFTKGHNNCRIRKIRTLADVRRLREKSNASRDLTSSFNEEARSASTVIVRLSRSLSNPSINMDSVMSSTAADVMTPNTVDMTDDDNDKGKTKSGFDSPDASPESHKFKGHSEAEINQRLNFMNTDSTSSLRASSSSLEKRPFENIGTTAENEFDPDEVPVNDGNKFIKLLDDEHVQKFRFKGEEGSSSLFTSTSTDDLRPKFSLDLEDRNTLDEARKLLGKSEALRMQYDSEGGRSQLEMDTFYQYISEHNDCERLSNSAKLQQKPQQNSLPGEKDVHDSDETEGTKFQQREQRGKLSDTEEDGAELSSLNRPKCVRMSTPDDSMFDSMEEKISAIEGVKLGSEIAAEILKRAGEDLAHLTTLIVDSSSNSNSNQNATSSSHQ